METIHFIQYRATLEFRRNTFHGDFPPSSTCCGLSAFQLILCVPDRFNVHQISADVCCHQLAQVKERWFIFSPSKMTFWLHPMMTSFMVGNTYIILEIFGPIVERVNGIDFIQQNMITLVTMPVFNRALSQWKFSVNTISLVTIWFAALLLKLSSIWVSRLKI